MKRFWKFAGIATLVAILGVAAVGAVAYAQDDGSGGPFDFGGRFREAVANILGITVDEYNAAVQQAQEQVVDEAFEEGWLTEDQAERMRERMDESLAPRGMDKGFMEPRGGLLGRGGDSLVSMMAEEMDMSVRDLVAELQEDKTLADVASEHDVDAQAVADAYLAQLQENLTQAVADGKITQNQADWMLQQATESVPDQLNSTWEDCGPHRFPGGGRPGRMEGFPGQSDA